MLHRARSHSPEKKNMESKATHRGSLNIKLNSEDDFSHISESFTDPIIKQITAHVPTKTKKDHISNDNNTAEVLKHFDEMLLPEEWLELDPVYLCAPPSLDTKEFQDILKVRYYIMFISVYHFFSAYRVMFLYILMIYTLFRT